MCDGSWQGQTVWNYGAPNSQCANVRCVKDLPLVNSVAVTAQQCVAKAQRDPQCSNIVMHDTDGDQICQCWTNTNPACCGTCKAVDAYFNLNPTPQWHFNIYDTEFPIVSDPTCATGVKSADGNFCCPKSCNVCQNAPLFKVSFQNYTAPAPLNGWAVDSGKLFGSQSNQFPQPLSSNYGWNCDLSAFAGMADPTACQANNYAGTNYHNTWINTQSKNCAGAVPTWTLQVGANATAQFFDVHLLYSGQSFGCTLNGFPAGNAPSNNYQGNIIWSVLAANTTTGTLVFAAPNNCASIDALIVFAPTPNYPGLNCQNLPGTCCPHLVDMPNRPCSTFSPPCRLT